MNKKVLTWRETGALVEQLRDKLVDSKIWLNVRSIYGIPRGGQFIALMLSQLTKVPITNIVDGMTLIVDDIVDSGATMAKYHGRGMALASLHVKPHSSIKPHFYVEKTNDWIVYPWEDAKNESIEDNIRRVLELIGENPNREGLLDTPKRVAKAYEEWFGGYKQDPKEILKTTFNESYDEMISLCNIEFVSNCEHHIARIQGVAHVAYIPSGGRVVGLSKLARLVDCFAHRLQIQERMTEQIATSLFDILEPLGCMVIIEAKHDCVSSRGVKKQNSVMVTSAVRGVFADPRKGARQEFLSLVSKHG